MIGHVLELGRFPVKSMLGESPERVELTSTGVVGDRMRGLVDVETGKVASAKDPRRWTGLLACRARGTDRLMFDLPDGTTVADDDADLDARLSAAVGRKVRLATPAADGTYDYVWEEDDLAPADVVAGTRTGTTEDGHPVSTMPLAMMAPGTFQDVAPVTLLTTAALAFMRRHHPAGDWDPARFRSNLLLDVLGDEVVENGWVGRRLAVGSVVLEVTAPAPRCVMTTLAQPGFGRDREILRTVARHNRQEFAGFGMWACLGAYATVLTPGEITVGDAVELVS